jgi:hypothetical protein
MIARGLLGILFTGMMLSVFTISGAQAACPERLAVNVGDTLWGIARACGISVETLRGANPGLNERTLRPGLFLAVPRPALPSPQQPVGRPSLRVAPPLVPPATITVPTPAQPPVILHPQMPPEFDTRPRHLRPRRPPLGHPPFPHQQN